MAYVLGFEDEIDGSKLINSGWAKKDNHFIAPPGSLEKIKFNLSDAKIMQKIIDKYKSINSFIEDGLEDEDCDQY